LRYFGELGMGEWRRLGAFDGFGKLGAGAT
jgi:hypothetical protein